MTSIHRHPGLRSVLSGLVSLVFLTGFAACLVCDIDSCCEDTEHEDEPICACACAFHSAQVVTDPLVMLFEVRGEGIHDAATSPDAAPPDNLYRPPRA